MVMGKWENTTKPESLTKDGVLWDKFNPLSFFVFFFNLLMVISHCLMVEIKHKLG